MSLESFQSKAATGFGAPTHSLRTISVFSDSGGSKSIGEIRATEFKRLADSGRSKRVVERERPPARLNIITSTTAPGNGITSLHTGILIFDSPRCQERLQISLNSNPFNAKREEISLHGQM